MLHWATPSIPGCSGRPARAMVRILDNDLGISFDQSDYWVSEAAGEISLTVRRGNDALSEPFTVNYSTSQGTATAGSDFVATTGTLAFAEGDQTQTIVIPIWNDGRREDPEYFQVSLSDPSGAYRLGTLVVTQVTIEDNDPGVSFTQTDFWVSEGVGQIALTVQRGNDVTLEPFDVMYLTSAGTATAGADFEATAGTLSFEAGDLTKTITVPIVNDALREEQEAFRVSLRNAPGQAVLPATPEVYVNIEDNDRGVHWVSNGSRVDEAAGVARIIVRRGNDVDLRPISVDYTLRAVSAKAGLDFAGGSGSTAFAEGDLEATVEVPILNDALREETENFEIRLTGTTSPVGLAPEPVATVEIGDNDPGAGFSTWGWEAKEGQGIVEITVIRGNDVDLGRMTVDYRLAPATAQPGQDYVEAAGTVVFEESEVQNTFAITLLDDADWEGDEELVARLSHHTGSGTLRYGAETTVRILDDDPVSWELVRGFPEAGDFRDLAVGNGRWIVPVYGPTGAALLMSGNGLNWERVDGMPVIVRLVYGAGEFLGITDQGEVIVSTDGLDWELKSRIVIAGNWPEKLIYGGGQYLLLEGDGRTWVSADGQSWSVGVLPQAGWVRDVTFGAGVFAAVTDQGKVLTSANGLEWSVAPVLHLGELHAVGFGDGQFVAVGRGSDGTGNWRGTVLSSLDGRTWDQQWLAEDWWISGIVFGDGKFVVVHESSRGGADHLELSARWGPVASGTGV